MVNILPTATRAVTGEYPLFTPSTGDITMTQEIVIIGAGVGGTVTANQLQTELHREIAAGDVRIRIISDTPEYVQNRFGSNPVGGSRARGCDPTAG